MNILSIFKKKVSPFVDESKTSEQLEQLEWEEHRKKMDIWYNSPSDENPLLTNRELLEKKSQRSETSVG